MGDYYISIDIVNWSSKTVVVKNVKLAWGKFYKDNDKHSEIPISDIENTKILPGKNFKINSSGRSDSSSGTEGEFDVYEEGGEKVRHFYWDLPWGSKTRTWSITERNPEWMVDSSDPGEFNLGNITVDLYKKGA